MDVRDLLAELRRCASIPVEGQFVDACLAALADETVTEGVRYHHVNGLLRSEAPSLIAAPWGCALDPSAWRALADLAGGAPEAAALLRRCVAGGLGMAATTLEIGGRGWVPRFAIREVERRSGATITVSEQRWFVPYWWPVPIEQCLVADFVDDQVSETLVGQLGLGVSAGMSVAAPEYPVAWMEESTAAIPATRDDLMALMNADPPSGVRALLTSFGGDPLAGAAQSIGVQAMHAAAQAAHEQQPWGGSIMGGASLARYGETIVVSAGWWRSVLVGLDCVCFGALPEDTVRVEQWLCRHGGGAEADIGQSLPVFIFPVHLGRPIRALPIDWSAVPELGGS
jgi:hypothetical protein